MQDEMRIKARVGIGLMKAVANDPIHALDTGCRKCLDELIRNLWGLAVLLCCLAATILTRRALPLAETDLRLRLKATLNTSITTNA